MVFSTRDIGERGNTSSWGGTCLAAAALCLTLLFSAGSAEAQTRSLKLHFTHTKERAEITYMRNGRYDQAGLDRVNHLLRDWRRNEPARMDPKLLDLLWEVYHSVGATDYIHVVSAYRSPATNSMLRSRSSGVAQNSQHMLGKAIDFFIPGVPVSKLRAAGFKAEGGGVGYYPRSGSPFVHLDTGNVRSWPRMNRQELMALFPDGRTVHVPTDGKPLPGYQQAMAAYQARQRSGAVSRLASAAPARASSGGGGGLLATLFGTGRDREAAPAPAPRTQVARSQPAPAAPSAPVPAAPVVASASPAETPQQQIVAALPARNAPVPRPAPRPSVGVGETAPEAAQAVAAQAFAPPSQAPAPASLAAAAVPVPAPAPTPDTRPVQMARAPIPTPRPAFTPPSLATETAEAPVQMASASMDDEPSVKAAPARGDAIAALTGDLRPGTAPVAALAAYAATPMRRTSTEEEKLLQAALPHLAEPTIGSTPAVEGPETELAREEAMQVTRRLARLGGTPSASPKALLIAREAGADPLAAMATGVRTTARSARVSPQDGRHAERARQRVPMPRAVARWALMSDPGAAAPATGGGSATFTQDAVLSAPRMVYTAGFKPGTETAKIVPSRFSGSAVNFHSVARFVAN